MGEIFVVAGLGNPGSRYEKTWHNAGFWQLDYLSQLTKIPIRQSKHQALIGKGTWLGQTLLLVQPQTYMNESGRSLREILQYYKIPSERLLVIYDDLDTPVGQIRMRPAGGAGTHNGMRSIVRELGTENFPRIRIGIGPKPAGWDLVDYVLSTLPQEQQKPVFQCLEIGARGINLWLERGLELAMNEVNRAGRPPKPRKKPKLAEFDESTEAANCLCEEKAQSEDRDEP